MNIWVFKDEKGTGCNMIWGGVLAESRIELLLKSLVRMDKHAGIRTLDLLYMKKEFNQFDAEIRCKKK
jgi:hypothetical protein